MLPRIRLHPIVELRAHRGLSRLSHNRSREVALAGFPGSRCLVPAGAVGEAVLARHGDDTVVLTGTSAAAVDNLACAPLAWWPTGPGKIVGRATDFDAVERERYVLTAAALVGIGQTAVEMGVRYANERSAFGTRIGAFRRSPIRWWMRPAPSKERAG